ncbi:MAG: YihA family ribosome biogenesis GTP-binding protein [Bacteroidetes bacterium]|nr:MAG: YihA family ribosome biogenesis GTP-binding protein [Bacteroidota bacterium]
MEINSAEFIKSATHYKDCPAPSFPEYAFLGRSNVGKSSLINMLTDHKKLAKTSSTPGKTQLINHFLINGSWYLADLPGFGFAKVSKKIRGTWEKMIQNYLLNRENLICSFLLIDSRLEPQKNDTENMEWFGSKGLPFALVFTKTDKLSSTALQSNLAFYRKKLAENWDPLPDMFITSAEKKIGREEILGFIDHYNREIQSK